MKIQAVGECSLAKIDGVSFNPKVMMCADGEEGTLDTCQGDSGGGLMIGDTLVRVTSFGLGCGRINKPRVYIKASAVKSWIDRILNIR